MAKQIVYSSEAKTKVKAGIDAVANAVKSTLGPKGNTVLMKDGFDLRVTKDGVSVAKSIELEDKLQDVGAQLVKKVASKTADDAGDGTTSATVLAQAIIDEGTKLIAAGVSPSEIKRGIDIAVEQVIEYFKKHSMESEGVETLEKIATISANGDETIGKLIAEVIEKVGAEGVVNVETSKTMETYIDRVEGLRYDRGFLTPYFVTNPDKMEARLEDAYVLITDQRITTLVQIQPVLELVAAEHKPLLIIADEISGEALTMLVINKSRGTLQVVATKCPAFGERRNQELMDIAALTGGVVVSADQGLSLEKIEVEMLGKAQVIISTAKHTTIVGGSADQERVQERADALRRAIDEEKSSYNKSMYQERLAKLTNGVAVLYVGALTEIELNERKDRIDDALRATKAAFQEGTLPGGGIAYYMAARYLEATPMGANGNPVGYDLFKRALRALVAQIANNVEEGYDKVVLANLDAKHAGYVGTEDISDYGFNARTGEYGSMRGMGVIDPTKVCRCVVENASSIASMYLTTNCVIVDEPEKKDKEER